MLCRLLDAKPFSDPMQPYYHVTTLRPRQNGRHFADDTFKCIFLNGSVWISIKLSLNFVLTGSINNIPALVQIMAWHRPGAKPSTEPMMFSLRTHTCVTGPQWVTNWIIRNRFQRDGNQNIFVRENDFKMSSANCEPFCPYVNSLRLGDTYMRQWTMSFSVQIMACRLFGAKPLCEPMMVCCQLGNTEQISKKFYSKFKVKNSRKCIWKYRLQNGGHLFPASMC